MTCAAGLLLISTLPDWISLRGRTTSPALGCREATQSWGSTAPSSKASTSFGRRG